MWLAGEMRRMLALGLAGGSSLAVGEEDREDRRRFADGFNGEAPRMAASKNSRSLRRRNMGVGVLAGVRCWCGIWRGGARRGGHGFARNGGVERDFSMECTSVSHSAP